VVDHPKTDKIAIKVINHYGDEVLKVYEPPHFHAVYGGDEALIEIESLTVYRGELPQRALAMVLEWAALHRQELRRDWDLARRGRPPEPIAPLE